MHEEHKGLLYALGATIAVSINAVLIKLIIGVPLETMVFMRFSIAFLLILPSVIRCKVHLHVKHIPKHFIRALLGLLSINCYYYSLQHLPLVNAVTLTNTAPLFTPLVVFVWLKSTLPKIKLMALLIGFFGVLIILRPTQIVNGWASLVGLSGALCSSFAVVGIRQLSKTESTITIMAYYFLTSITFLFIPMISTWQPIENPINWVYLALVGLFTTIFQFCLTKSLTHSPATKVGYLTYLRVVFAGFFGWLVFSEMPSYWNIAGTALIILGGVIAILSKDPARKLEET